VTVILLSLLFGGPFIKINGQPLLLLNVLERKFIIFGQAFWPQDFVLLAVTLIAFFVFVILLRCIWSRLVWMAVSANLVHGNGIRKLNIG
jgi:polyferredoxin